VRKALFVDHSFHQKTRSSDFFVDVVRQGFEVETYYLTPEGDVDVGVLSAAADADVVLLWQLDFLAPLFRAMGKPTVVIPMYDGSAGLPDLHWAFASEARFFNFSLRLHERVRLLGGETKLLRYFPAPKPESELPRFDSLDAFFWQRRPDHGVTYSLIDELIGAELDSFHLHNVPDVPFYLPNSRRSDPPYRFTESSWFERKSDYEKCLASANVFIAPRASEGIGLALLEGMARGMLVLAHDAPTNNEYISNGVNGILFNKNVRHDPIGIRADAQRMGRLAWRTVVDGHQRWLESHPAILAWIEGAPATRPIDLDFESFLRDLWTSYYGSLMVYETFLQRNVGVLERMSSLPLPKILEVIGGTVISPGGSSSRHDDRLDPTGLLDLTLEGDRYTVAGWSSAEPEWRWAVGTSAELHFSGFNCASDRARVRFVASALPQLGKQVRCKMVLNGVPVDERQLGPDWKEYEFGFDAGLLEAENRLSLTFDKAKSLPTDNRELSVCFKSFRFSEESQGLREDDLSAGAEQGRGARLARPQRLGRLLERVQGITR